MQEIVIDTRDKLEKILTACRAGGHSRIGGMSNAGLPKGLVRVTILPNSAFLQDVPVTTDEAWLEAYRDIINYDGQRKTLQ